MGSDMSGRDGHGLDKKFPAERAFEITTERILQEKLAQAKQEGRQEVVDWLNERYGQIDWQGYLEENGLK